MSDYDAERIEKPEYFKVGPLARGRGNRKVQVIGFDSEADTTTGRPMLIQLSETGDENDVKMYVVPEDIEHAALGYFLTYLGERCTRKDTEYIVYGFNLMYEFTQLFGQFEDDWRVMPELHIDSVVIDTLDRSYRFKVDVVNDKRYMCRITNLATKRQIKLLDAMAFYKTSLDKAAKMLGLGEKYHDDDFDVSKITRADLADSTFLYYAARDAFITRRIGEHIMGLHDGYDVPTCISAPHFAATVFRHRFMNKALAPLTPELEQAGLWSYHGGKNGHYLSGPHDLPNVHQYDITSAYPEAMRQLPDIEEAKWYEVRSYEPGRHAIYKTTLDYQRCPWRGMMAYDGTWPQGGYVEDIFLTSYELDAMIERDECRILSIMGWSMEGPQGGPLMRYVDRFFDMKARSVGPERETAKLFLNSLYGKFFQKVPLGSVGRLDMDTMEFVVSNPDSPFDWRAGGLYHPPIASLITGFVRARIHGLEHKYESVMTSTDGIFGMQPPDATDLGTELGMLTHKDGHLRLWKERLYIFRPHDGSDPKWAAHSFRGNMDALDAIPVAPGEYEYKAKQLVTLKLSTIGLNGERYEPGRFVELPFTINIPK